MATGAVTPPKPGRKVSPPNPPSEPGPIPGPFPGPTPGPSPVPKDPPVPGPPENATAALYGSPQGISSFIAGSFSSWGPTTVAGIGSRGVFGMRTNAGVN